MRDLANSIAAVASLDAAVRTADTDGATVDLQGFESATVVAMIGAEGDTLDASNYVEFVLQHSDDDSTWSAVADADVVEGSVSSGAFSLHDDAAEAPAVATIGYVGGKRYVRVNDARTGTHTNGTATSAVVIKGHARHSINA